MADLLNLGCGNRILRAGPGDQIVNHDRRAHRPEVAVAHDLNLLPWPWGDGSFDLIVARAVLEHLRLNLVESLDECWRILRPRGRLQVKVPYWQADASWSDPTHYWKYSLDAFDQFDPDTVRGQEYGFYTQCKWRIVRRPRLNPARTSILATLEVRK